VRRLPPTGKRPKSQTKDKLTIYLVDVTSADDHRRTFPRVPKRNLDNHQTDQTCPDGSLHGIAMVSDCQEGKREKAREGKNECQTGRVLEFRRTKMVTYSLDLSVHGTLLKTQSCKQKLASLFGCLDAVQAMGVTVPSEARIRLLATASDGLLLRV
jgi:hypothetical protein